MPDRGHNIIKSNAEDRRQGVFCSRGRVDRYACGASARGVRRREVQDASCRRVLKILDLNFKKAKSEDLTLNNIFLKGIATGEVFTFSFFEV